MARCSAILGADVLPPSPPPLRRAPTAFSGSSLRADRPRLLPLSRLLPPLLLSLWVGAPAALAERPLSEPSGEEGSCFAADGSGVGCDAGASIVQEALPTTSRTARPTAGPPQSVPSSPQASVFAGRRAGLLAQELEELRGLSQLYRERISLLEELQGVLADGSASGVLPEGLPWSSFKALQEGLPALAEVTASEASQPAASDGDFIVSKAVVPQEQEVLSIQFLPLRNPRGANPTPSGQVVLPTSLLVAAQLDGTLRLFTPSGELASTFGAGHDKQLQHVTVSPLHDEYIIATCDVGSIVRVHKVNVRQRRLAKEDREARKGSIVEKLSQHLGTQVNVTVQYNRRFRMPNGTDGVPLRVTAFSMVSVQGTKYFVSGHEEGNFTVHTRNGTIHARLTSGTGQPVDAISVHLSTVLFTSGGKWGFVDLDKLEAKPMPCPRFDGRVVSAVLDGQRQNRVLVSDEFGDVWVFNIHEKRRCKIEHRFPRGTVQPPVELQSVRGFAITLHHRESEVSGGSRRSVLTALNMSHAGKKRDDLARSVPVVVWRRLGPPVRDWAVHKQYQQGDLVAMLSEDGFEIEMFELLMQVYVQPQAESLSNFKMPVFAVAIVLVMGYQYVKGKGAFDPAIVEGLSPH